MVEENQFDKLFNSLKGLLKTPIIQPSSVETSDDNVVKSDQLDNPNHQFSNLPQSVIDEEAIRTQIKEIVAKESGWDRVKSHFTYE